MKHRQYRKIVTVLAVITILPLLPACSGFMGKTGSVVLNIPMNPQGNGTASRYIAPGITGAEVFIMQSNTQIRHHIQSGTGPLFINSLEPGRYVFLIFLKGTPDSNTPNGDLCFAVKEIMVEPGLNTAHITVMPALRWSGSPVSPAPFGSIRDLLLWENVDNSIVPGTPVMEYADNQLTVQNIALTVDASQEMGNTALAGNPAPADWYCTVNPDSATSSFLYEFEEYISPDTFIRGAFRLILPDTTNFDP